jgi:hypothetical protein
MGVHRITDMDAARADPTNVTPLHLMASVAPEIELDPVNWGIPFQPQFSANFVYWPLFRRDNGKLAVNLLEMKDMPDPPLGRNLNETGVRRIGPNNRPTQRGAF